MHGYKAGKALLTRKVFYMDFKDLPAFYQELDSRYSRLHEVPNSLVTVDYEEFNAKYNARDAVARKNMRELVDSDANKVTKVFSTLL